MIIQQRDKEMLRRRYEQQFLHLGHVRRYFFKGAGLENARVRVVELERAGLLRRERIAARDGGLIIRLTRTGAPERRVPRGAGRRVRLQPRRSPSRWKTASRHWPEAHTDAGYITAPDLWFRLQPKFVLARQSGVIHSLMRRAGLVSFSQNRLDLVEIEGGRRARVARCGDTYEQKETDR